jgi:SAM-dependent methyltransferase
MKAGLEGSHWDDHNHDNLLDKTPEAWRSHYYEHFDQRVNQLLSDKGAFENRALRVVSVGCGSNARLNIPQRSDIYVIGVDSDEEQLKHARTLKNVDELHLGSATSLPVESNSVDVVLFRLVLHHLADQGPLDAAFDEARRVLKPGGRLIAIEPGIFHPIGFILFCSNHLKLSKHVMGTSDDWPLSPLRIRRELEDKGFATQVFGVEYGWRRLPIGLQRLVNRLDSLGSLPVVKHMGHTFLTIAQKS